MAETFRDVILRVSIQAANARMGAIDTSAAQRSMASIHEAVNRAMLPDVAAINQSAQQVAAAYSNAIRVGRPGYGDSVRARAQQAASEAVNQMRGAGQLDNADDGQVMQVLAGLARQAEAMIRERDREAAAAERDSEQIAQAAEAAYDREAAAAVRSYSLIMRERERAAAEAARETERQERAAEAAYDREAAEALRAYSRIMRQRQRDTEQHERAQQRYQQTLSQSVASTAQFAKGLALLAVSGTDNSEAMVQNIAAIQGYFDVVSGGVQTLQTLISLMRQQRALAAASAATNAAGSAASAGGGMMGMFRGLLGGGGGAAAATGGAAAGGGIMGALGMTLAVSATAVFATTVAIIIAELAVLKVSMDEASQATRQFWSDQESSAERASQRVSEALTRRSDAFRNISKNLPDAREIARIPKNISQNEYWESVNRKEETNYNRSDAQRAENRSYNAALERRNLAGSESVDDYNLAQEKLRRLRAERSDREKRAANLEPAFQARESAIERERVEGSRDAIVNKQSILPWAVSKVYGGVMSGSVEKAENKRLDDLAEKSQQNRADHAKTLYELQKRNEDSKRTELELEKQSAAAMARRYQANMDLLKVARDRVRDERDAMRAGDVQFASQSYGDQARELRLQAKHERIVEQQKRKDAGENVDVEQYTRPEIEFGMGTGNIAMQTIRNQLVDRARKAGVKKEDGNADELQAREAELKRIEGIVKPEMDQAKDLLQKAGESTKQMATDLLNEMKNTFVTQDLYEELKAGLRELQANNKSKDQSRQRWFGG